VSGLSVGAEAISWKSNTYSSAVAAVAVGRTTTTLITAQGVAVVRVGSCQAESFCKKVRHLQLMLARAVRAE
jgi:hypothetical protein